MNEIKGKNIESVLVKGKRITVTSGGEPLEWRLKLR